MRAGFCDFVLLDPSQRKIAGRDGAGRSGKARRIYCAACGAGDSDYFVGRGGAGGGERTEDFTVGDVHTGDDDSDRVVDGRVLAIFAAGTSAGSVADWIGTGAVRGRSGAVGSGFGVLGARVYVEWRGAGVLDYRVRICGVGVAGLAVARAEGLFERVHQSGRDFFFGGGNLDCAAGNSDAGADEIH